MRLDGLATSPAIVQAYAADLQALFLEAQSVRSLSLSLSLSHTHTHTHTHTYITLQPCCRHIMQVLLTDFVKKIIKLEF